MDVNELVKDGKQAQSTSEENGSASTPNDAGKTNGEKTITLSGKTFKVSDDHAEAFAEFTKGIDQRFSERAQELGELRQYKANTLSHKQEPVSTNNQYSQEELSELMFTDPAKYNQIMLEKMKQEIEMTKNELKQEYQNDRRTEKESTLFWNSMWDENKDLALIKKQATDVIGLVGGKYKELDLPNTKEVRDMLANEAREWLKGIGQQTVNDDSADAFMERTSSHPNRSTPKKEEEPKRKPTSDILRELQEKRQEALAKRQ